MDKTVNMQVWEDTRDKIKVLAKSNRDSMKKYLENLIDREYRKNSRSQ